MYSWKYEQMFQHIYKWEVGKKARQNTSKCFSTCISEFTGICAETFARKFYFNSSYIYFFMILNIVYVLVIIRANVLIHISFTNLFYYLFNLIYLYYILEKKILLNFYTWFQCVKIIVNNLWKFYTWFRCVKITVNNLWKFYTWF